MEIVYTILVAFITIGLILGIWVSSKPKTTIESFFSGNYIRGLEASGCKSSNEKFSELDGKISSITTNQNRTKDATNNFTYTLKDYYIKTAYNACSTGYYKNDVVSTCILKDILKQGVRGFDFEIFSSADNPDEPIVATSMEKSFYVKNTFNSVPFAEVLSIFKNFAYSSSTAPNPNDPIILHLRFNSANQKMYTRIARLFESMNNLLLGPTYSFENKGRNLGNVPLLDLVGKIVIIVDKSNAAFMDNADFKEYVNMTSNSVFMRTLRFTNGVKYTTDIDEMKVYNKQNMSVVLPDDETNPDNPGGLLSRALGCQMVAMRYQKQDSNLAEDTNFFDENGHAFVLKPVELRYIPVTIPAPPPPNPKLSYAPQSMGQDSGGLYSFKI
jgi:hypothetical protein